MRAAGLLVLAVLFPACAHATVIFTEVMYDYPGSEGSGDHDWVEIYNDGSSAIDLGGSTVRFMERGNNHLIASFDGNTTILATGAVAVIANNPTQVKLDFPGIGLLLDSSFSLTGTSTALGIIVDGVNVSPTTYTPLASASNLGNSLQFVSGSWTAATPTPGTYAGASTPSDSSTPSAAATVSSNTAPPEYMPIPTLRILTGGDRTVSSGADAAFTSTVYDSKGNRRDEALVKWSFGDGMQRTGANVFHSFYDPGEYIVTVRATTSDGGDVRSDIVVTVKSASIRIAAVSSRGITLANDDSRTLDLSLWRLAMGGREFKIPADTQILAGRTVLFPSQIIQLPVTDSAQLLYPSGEVVAAVYPKTMVAQSFSSTSVSEGDRQPSVSEVSYEKVQTVGNRKASPAVGTEVTIHNNGQAVTAPREVTNSSTPRGATLLAASAEAASPPNSGFTSLFRSPWTLSFLGVMAIAGGAFILL